MQRIEKPPRRTAGRTALDASLEELYGWYLAKGAPAPRNGEQLGKKLTLRVQKRLEALGYKVQPEMVAWVAQAIKDERERKLGGVGEISGEMKEIRVANDAMPPKLAEAWAAVRHFVPAKKIGRGQYLFREGDLADHLHFVEEGRLKLTFADPDDKTRSALTLQHVGAGQMLGAAEFLATYSSSHGAKESEVKRPVQAHAFAAQAFERSSVRSISFHELERLLRGPLKEHALEVSLLLGQKAAGDLAVMTERVRLHGTHLDTRHRLLRILDEICRNWSMTHPFGSQISMTRTELGSLIGASREMTGQLIKDLAAEGLIVESGKTIVVLGRRYLHG